MSVKVVDQNNVPFTLKPDEPVPEPPSSKGKRKFSRPTTPELEALFFRVAVHCTKREMALLQWAMGRSPDGGEALAELFLHPEPISELP